MTTRNRVTVVVGLYVVAGMVYAASRMSLHVPNLPPLAWAFLAGLALRSRLSFKAGQYARGYSHARGIRRSHWAAIQGGHK